MIRINIEKNNKNWQIIENDEVVIRATRPKWYSTEVKFFFNGKTYQIINKSFWKWAPTIFQGGMLIGSFTHSYEAGYQINIHTTGKIYKILQENKGGMWRINKEYSFCEIGQKPMFIIKYSKKNFSKEVIEIKKINLNNLDYDLIMYGLSLMRVVQAFEYGGGDMVPTFYG